MACRFPGGVVDPRSYWQLLCAGVDAVREKPPMLSTGRPLGRRPLLRPRSRRPRQDVLAVRRVSRRDRSLRQPLLRHLRPRGGADRSAAAPVAGIELGSVGGRRPAAVVAAGYEDRRLRGHFGQRIRDHALDRRRADRRPLPPRALRSAWRPTACRSSSVCKGRAWRWIPPAPPPWSPSTWPASTSATANARWPWPAARISCSLRWGRSI